MLAAVKSRIGFLSDERGLVVVSGKIAMMVVRRI